ncbi:hypothetical protein J6590_108148, partial [Homalodisca vitripennis]
CSETRSEKLLRLLSVRCSSRSTWLANSPTFGRVPVSAVSGTDAASLPTALPILIRVSEKIQEAPEA